MTGRTLRRLLLPWAIAIAPAWCAAADFSKLLSAASHRVDSAKEIRPILEQACCKCHGFDEHKGGQCLDRRADFSIGADENGSRPAQPVDGFDADQKYAALIPADRRRSHAAAHGDLASAC